MREGGGEVKGAGGGGFRKRRERGREGTEGLGALDRKGPQSRPQTPLDRRLKEVAKAVGFTNATETGTCRQGDSGWAEAWRPGGG